MTAKCGEDLTEAADITLVFSAEWRAVEHLIAPPLPPKAHAPLTGFGAI